MRKRICAVLLAAVLLTVLVALPAAAGGKAEGKQLTFGYIMPGPDPWYGYAKDGFLFAAAKHNVKVVLVNSDYDQQKELANIDDLITQKVDGMNLFSFNPDGAQIAAQKANSAKIPLSIEMSALAAGPGQIVCDIEFDWTNLGVLIAEKIAQLWPGQRVLEITGLVGQGPVDLYLAGFQKRMKELGKNELVGIHPADYNREKAMNIMQNMLQSGQQFTVVHVGNEDMAMGVLQVLKDAGKLNNPIRVISNNGSPEGLEAIKKGDLAATISTSPGVEGLVVFEALYRHAMGQKVPEKVMIPMIPIDESNVDQAVSWVVDDNAYKLVVEMFDKFQK
jgi:ribose transport system substrate-binding protein